MLEITAKVNGVIISKIELGNISELARISDYSYNIQEKECEELGIEELDSIGIISRHNRYQTVWALVKKVIEAEHPELD